MRKRVRKLTRRKTNMTKAKSKGKRGVYIKRKKNMTKAKSKGKRGVYIKRKNRKKSTKLRKKRTQKNSHMGGSTGYSITGNSIVPRGPTQGGGSNYSFDEDTLNDIAAQLGLDYARAEPPVFQENDDLEQNDIVGNTSQGDVRHPPPSHVVQDDGGAGWGGVEDDAGGLNLDAVEAMVVPPLPGHLEGNGAEWDDVEDDVEDNAGGLNLDVVQSIVEDTTQGDMSSPSTVGTDTQAPAGRGARAKANWGRLRLYGNVHLAMRQALKNIRELEDTGSNQVEFSSEEQEMMRNALNLALHDNPGDDIPPSDTQPIPNMHEIWTKYLNAAWTTLKYYEDDCIYFIEAMINSHKNKEFITFLVEYFVDSKDEREINPGIGKGVKTFYDFCTRMIMIGIEPKDRPGDFKYQREFNEDIHEWVEPEGEIAYEPWWSSGDGDRDYIIDRLTQIYNTHRPDKIKQIDNLMATNKKGYGKYGYLLLTAVILKYKRNIDISPMIGEVFPKGLFAKLFS